MAREIEPMVASCQLSFLPHIFIQRGKTIFGSLAIGRQAVFLLLRRWGLQTETKYRFGGEIV
jgi:hypothetical protein